MTPLQVLALGGLIVGAGLVLLVTAVRPAAPSLQASLAQLSLTPRVTRGSAVSSAITVEPEWWQRLLPASVRDVLHRHVGVPEADLKLLDLSRTQLISSKLKLGLAGLLCPSVLSAWFTVLGVGVPFVVPGVMAVVLAAVLWVLPSQSARERAAAARLEFRTNLQAFLTLVAGERGSRGSMQQNMQEAASVSNSRPFVLLRQTINRAVTRARSTEAQVWGDLRTLGEEIAVPDLMKLVNIAENAQVGGKVGASLVAAAAGLRSAELNDRRAAANEVSERMSRPLALLVAGLTLFFLIPFVLRLSGAN